MRHKEVQAAVAACDLTQLEYELREAGTERFSERGRAAVEEITRNITAKLVEIAAHDIEHFHVGDPLKTWHSGMLHRAINEWYAECDDEDVDRQMNEFIDKGWKYDLVHKLDFSMYVTEPTTDRAVMLYDELEYKWGYKDDEDLLTAFSEVTHALAQTIEKELDEKVNMVRIRDLFDPRWPEFKVNPSTPIEPPAVLVNAVHSYLSVS